MGAPKHRLVLVKFDERDVAPGDLDAAKELYAALATVAGFDIDMDAREHPDAASVPVHTSMSVDDIMAEVRTALMGHTRALGRAPFMVRIPGPKLPL